MDLRHNAACLLSTATIAAMDTASEREIYTVPTGKVCILAFAFLEADGDLGDVADASIGETGGGSQNFVASTALDSLSADGDVILLAPVPSATPGTLKAYAAASIIYLDIINAANAVAGTCYLFGFLYNA